MSEHQDLNITDISSEKETPKLKLVATRIKPDESGTFEGNVMEKITKGNKRSADDSTVTIEKFLKSKRLRRTLMNEEEEEEGGEDNGGGGGGGEEEEEEGEGDTGEYGYEYGEDEEMVIVVVQKEGENANYNEYGQVESSHFEEEEEEVAYDGFMNESEGTGNFMNESEGPGVEEKPVMQETQTITSKENPVERKIIGTKSLTVRKELCRLCLSKHSNMYPLFETSLTFIKNSLKDIIESCIGIKVLREDATDRICRACISRLESIWAFREQCEKSNILVKQMKRIMLIPGLADGNQNSNTGNNLCNNEPMFNQSKPRQFFCINCERSFYTEVALSAHVTNDHAHLKPFTHKASFLVSCSICGRKVIKKVLHDHYLQHKLLGEGRNGKTRTVNHQVADFEEEEYEEDVDDVEDDEEDGEEEIEEGESEDGVTGGGGGGGGGEGGGIGAGGEHVPSFADLGDNETLDGEQITGFLNKEDELTYKQNECFVTDITGSEFINVNRVEGQDDVNIIGGDSNLEDQNNPKVITVRINEDVQSGNFGETSGPQYTQVFLVNQAENLVETSVSQGNNVENNIIHDVVSTATLDENHIYVVASDGKSMYVDNQDVVFQIANDQVYQTDTSGGVMVKDEIEVVYENTNMAERVLVKEEVIDPSYDQ